MTAGHTAQKTAALHCHTPGRRIQRRDSALHPARHGGALDWDHSQEKARASSSTRRSWPRPPARSRRRFSRRDCDISRLLSRKQVNIAAAANGLDALLVALIRTQLAPQVAHMHVNAAV